MRVQEMGGFDELRLRIIDIGEDDPVLDIALGRDDDDQKAPLRKPQKLDVAEHRTAARRYHHPHELRQAGEQLRRIGDDLLRLLGRQFGRGQRVALHRQHGVDKQPVAARRGSAACRCVRAGNQPQIFQVGHHMADRRRREVDPGRLRQGSGAYGLRIGDIALDQGFEQQLGTVIQHGGILMMEFRDDVQFPPCCPHWQVPGFVRRRHRREFAPGARRHCPVFAAPGLQRCHRGGNGKQYRVAALPVADGRGHRRPLRSGSGGWGRRHDAGHRPQAGPVRHAVGRHQPGAPGLHHRHPVRYLPSHLAPDARRRLRGGFATADTGLRHARRAGGVRGAGDERCGREPGGDRRHGGTARGGRRPLRGQSAGGRADHRLAHRIDRLFAVRWRPDAASVDSWLGAGSDRAAYPVQPPHRAVGRHRGGGRSRQRPGCQRQLRYAVAGLVAPWRQDFAQPVSALRALFAPARLELLRHLAQETALERRRPLTMALRRITLRDFVIVQALELELDAGFTVLTGETGAGKSILIDALQLALGARAEAGVVREGAHKTDICAEFDCPAHVLPWLQEAGFDGDDLLLLRRTVDAQGKSRAWINATPATAAQLRALGDMLLDIHGQHAWQSLTRPESVRGLLDAFAAVSAAETAARWAQWRADQKALQQASQAQAGWQQERERLQWQIGEVDKLAPAAGQWDELDAQHRRLSHAQALVDGADGAIRSLQDDESGALAGLARAHALLQAQEHIEPEFANLAEILSSSLAQASDVLRSLQSYLRRAPLDPQRLAALDARMSLWMGLARRYKRPPAQLPALLDDWKAQLRQLDSATDLEPLQAAQAASAKAYQAAARALSVARAKAAPRLSTAITRAMQGLGMEGGKFEVAVSKAPH